jgi:hypothetical protein
MGATNGTARAERGCVSVDTFSELLEDREAVESMVDRIIESARKAKNIRILTAPDKDAELAGCALFVAFEAIFKTSTGHGRTVTLVDGSDEVVTDESTFYIALMSHDTDLAKLIKKYRECNVVFMQQPTSTRIHGHFVLFMAQRYIDTRTHECKEADLTSLEALTTRYEHWQEFYKGLLLASASGS